MAVKFYMAVKSHLAVNSHVVVKSHMEVKTRMLLVWYPDQRQDKVTHKTAIKWDLHVINIFEEHCSDPGSSLQH